MKPLNIIDSGNLSAEDNMAIDSDLLASLEETPLLRFYGWRSPGITYGHFIKPEKFLNLDAIHCAGWELARRPTGGGIIFHLWDFTFSFLLPASHPSFSHNTLNNYAFVNSMVAESLKELMNIEEISLLQAAQTIANAKNFCMAQPTIYDLIINGKKVGGAAQRKTKKGLLHQGSLSLHMPDSAILKKFLIDGKEIAPMMMEATFPLDSLSEEKDLHKTLKNKMIENFSHI